MDDNDLREVQEMILTFLKWGPILFIAVGFIASIIGTIINPCLENLVAIFFFAIPLVILMFLYPIYFR